MANENKLLTGMLVGAVIGAAVSLLDKRTREDVIQSCKKVSSKMKGYIDQPTTLTTDVKKKIDEAKDIVQEVSDDLSFVNEKVKGLKETTPQVVNMIQETRDRFMTKREQS
ncbi:YtxH domain-containing protein [uncultured Metabacillus sp.]|uniref:YtxH domain-containing protein n=1 Tax=uncultured Metabacillus sp. TaxID=2860135 RepID=UPI002627345D|nr:YtxH domain-containing protein [uncultured Metabacillus sp.]